MADALAEGGAVHAAHPRDAVETALSWFVDGTLAERSRRAFGICFALHGRDAASDAVCERNMGARNIKNVLTIAGVDPSGGAGVLADSK